jgi:hypothetical protein
MSELSIHDLESQTGELLPEREALGGVNFGSFNNHVIAINSAEAVQAVTAFSLNNAAAGQTVITL